MSKTTKKKERRRRRTAPAPSSSGRRRPYRRRVPERAPFGSDGERKRETLKDDGEKQSSQSLESVSFFHYFFLSFHLDEHLPSPCPSKMSASLRVVAMPAGAVTSRVSSSSRAAAAQMTVGCPAVAQLASPSPSPSCRATALGMPPRRLAITPRAVRADAPTETLDSATVDAISAVTAAANETHAAALARAKEEAASWTPAPAADASSLRAKVLNSVADVQQGLLEREVEVGEE